MTHSSVHKSSKELLCRLLLLVLLSRARWTPWTSNRLSCFFYCKWQYLYNTRNVKPRPARSLGGPLYHPPPCCSGPPTPPWDPEREWMEAVRVGGGKRETERSRGTSHAGSLCSLSGTNEIHIRCSVIKKQMTQCRAVFRCMALQLQMAHSHWSHHPLSHSHIPLQKHKHTQTHSGEPIWEWKEALVGVLLSWGDYINRWKRWGMGLQKMEEPTRWGTFTFVNFRCCLFPSFKLSQKRAYCLSTYFHISPAAELLQDNFIWLWFWILWSEFVHLEISKKCGLRLMGTSVHKTIRHNHTQVGNIKILIKLCKVWTNSVLQTICCGTCVVATLIYIPLT